MKQYKNRVVDGLLQTKLKGMGAVLIVGPKWCGKTTTAEHFAQSVVYMDDIEQGEDLRQMANINPRGLLQGKTPRLIDEWQLTPKLWDAVRFEVDHRDEEGQFILTGSAVPVSTEKMNHTGIGSFSFLTMRTMSLWESGESSGEVSLKKLFEQPSQIFGQNSLSIEDIAYLICRGGWPRAALQSKGIALGRAFDYYDVLVKTDISRVDGIRRDEGRTIRILRSYARNQASQSPVSLSADDIRANDVESIDDKTVYSYLNALKKMFVIEDLEAWNPNLRSKTAIRTSETRYFTDPSIGVAALGLGPKDLLNDLRTFGLFFETLCVRDLRIFADSIDGKVYHYRDKNDLECDAVIHLRNGSYGLVEIKLGGEKLINDGVKTLNALESKIDTSRMKPASFKMILTAVGKYAYRREDGIYIVPIGCVKD